MKTLLAAAASLALGGCLINQDAPSDLDRAIPTSDQVSIKLPSAEARTIGDLATYYVATRDVTRTFNGSTGWVLVLLHTIVSYPVTTHTGDTYEWGPWSDALDPSEYKLDVVDNHDGTYSYDLAGRDKTTAGSQFEDVITGVASTSGQGSFTLDFDAGRRVNPIDSGDATGSVDVSYDLAAKTLDLGISTTNAAGAPVEADYQYAEDSTGGGDMTFDVDQDQGGGPALEHSTLRSRWESTGAGRSDARVEGGDLGATQITASECWDTLFRRTFYTDSASFAPTEGAESDCAFTSSDLP
ncbi:MAG TPA: hypothetical protein VGM88_19685 [Kofleriaceae bacterium]|jgi:hypothetical protein